VARVVAYAFAGVRTARKISQVHADCAGRLVAIVTGNVSAIAPPVPPAPPRSRSVKTSLLALMSINPAMKILEEDPVTIELAGIVRLPSPVPTMEVSTVVFVTVGLVAVCVYPLVTIGRFAGVTYRPRIIGMVTLALVAS